VINGEWFTYTVTIDLYQLQRFLGSFFLFFFECCDQLGLCAIDSCAIDIQPVTERLQYFFSISFGIQLAHRAIFMVLMIRSMDITIRGAAHKIRK